MTELLLDPAQWLWMAACAAVSASVTFAFRSRIALKPFGPLTVAFGALPAFLVALSVVWLGSSPADLASSLDADVLLGWLLLLLAGLAASFATAKLFARRRTAVDTIRIFD